MFCKTGVLTRRNEAQRFSSIHRDGAGVSGGWCVTDAFVFTSVLRRRSAWSLAAGRARKSLFFSRALSIPKTTVTSVRDADDSETRSRAGRRSDGVCECAATPSPPRPVRVSEKRVAGQVTVLQLGSPTLVSE